VGGSGNLGISTDVIIIIIIIIIIKAKQFLCKPITGPGC
jgi:hypothetical protein